MRGQVGGPDSWCALAPPCRNCRSTSPAAIRPTSPARSASTARSSWPATRSRSRRCPPSSRPWAPRSTETNRYPDNGAVVLTRALADRYGVDPVQVATGCGAVTICQELAQAYNDPDTSIAFAWRSFEMYPLLARVAGARAIQVPLIPGRPAGRPTPTTWTRWRRRSTTAPAWSSSATRTTPRGRRCGGRSSSASSTRVPEQTLVVLDEAYREFVDRPRRPRRRGADARAAERRRAAHVLQGLGAGRDPRRLPDRRGPGGRRGGAQDPRAVQRLHAGPGRRRRGPGE